MRASFHITSTVLVSLAMTALVDAQTSPQGAKPDQTVTIAGCLVQGSPGAEGGRSESGAANANDYFVRTPTVAVPVGTTIAVGKPGTTSTATSAGTPTHDSFYRVTGLDRAQLKPHIGHRVELQGRLTSNTPRAEGVTTAKTTVDAGGRPTTKTETRPIVAGVLQATALKMVSATCP
jgi:hypothetical protein